MDSFTSADQPPVRSLCRPRVGQPRVPSERDTHTATIHKIDGEGLVADSNILSLSIPEISY